MAPSRTDHHEKLDANNSSSLDLAWLERWLGEQSENSHPALSWLQLLQAWKLACIALREFCARWSVRGSPTQLLMELWELTAAQHACLLGATLALAAVLSYVLVYRGDDSASSATTAPPPEEFFQRAVGAQDMTQFGGALDGGGAWSQTDDEVEVTLPLPPGTRAKDISCRVMPTSLRVAVLKEDERRMLVQGALLRKVRSDDSSWTIEASPSNDALRVLRLVLPKVVPTKGSQHWTSLLGEKVT